MLLLEKPAYLGGNLVRGEKIGWQPLQQVPPMLDERHVWHEHVRVREVVYWVAFIRQQCRVALVAKAGGDDFARVTGFKFAPAIGSKRGA